MSERTTIYVQLMQEGTEVWRPVSAERIGSDTFRILELPPDDEVWAFGAGAVVIGQSEKLADGSSSIVAQLFRPDETLITAEHCWQEDPSIMERINYLTYDYLRKVAVSDGGWAVLFQDPADGRYWELIYPYGEMNGGGPPRLCNIAADEAGKRYGV